MLGYWSRGKSKLCLRRSIFHSHVIIRFLRYLRILEAGPFNKIHRKGIDISKLKDKTGFDSKKIKYIVFELRKQGKIKSLRPGFYVKT